MDLAMDDEQVTVTQLARRLADEVLAPAARAAEGARAVPVPVWRKLFESGLTMPIPESSGGGGVPTALTQQLTAETLSYGDPGIALAALWNGAAAGFIAEHGTDAQLELLPALARGGIRRSAVAFYEGFGRSPHEYETTIVLEGDTVHVEGTKVAVAFADVADPLIVVGRDPRSGHIRAVLSSSSADGVSVSPTGPGLALDAAQLGTVKFGLTAPASSLLGGPDLDPSALIRSVQRLRLQVASALLGTAQHATEYAANYATERVAFGRPIAGFQGLSFPLAESLMRIEASRLQVADLITSEGRIRAETFDRAVSEAIAYASSIAVDATRHGVQSLGGHGFMQDHPVELWYRSATALAALDLDPVRAPFAPAL